MDKEWVRSNVEKRIGQIYGMRNPSPGDVDDMVEKAFSTSPVVNLLGYKELDSLFGCHQGKVQLKDHYRRLYSRVEVLALQKQFIVVDGFGASAHYRAEFRFRESGSVYDFEIIALTELDRDGRVRDIKLHYDTSTFLKAVHTPNATFRDVRGIMKHPPFDPAVDLKASEVAANLYNTFLGIYQGKDSWDSLWKLFDEDVEVVFKSNVEVIPYAGQYSNMAGLKKWFDNLLSIWSLATFNFTKTYSEGNRADFGMDEQHYYTNPDGSKRYLSVYLVQSWGISPGGKIHLFQSHHDSGWMDNTFHASQVYKTYYGYPADYPPKKKG